MSLEYGTKEWEEAYEKAVQDRLNSVSKPYVGFLSPEWVHEFQEVINRDEAYKKAAEKWEDTVVIEVAALPQYGVDANLCILLDLWHGECRSARIVPKSATEQAGFVFVGPFEHWQSIAKLEQDTLKLAMQGQLKTTGDLMKLMKFTPATKKLAECSASLNSVWIDELNAAELDEYKANLSEFRTQFGV